MGGLVRIKGVDTIRGGGGGGLILVGPNPKTYTLNPTLNPGLRLGGWGWGFHCSARGLSRSPGSDFIGAVASLSPTGPPVVPFRV